MRTRHPLFFHSLIAACAWLFSLSVSASLPIPAAPAINAKGYILIEHSTGQVLAQKNPDERLEPASLTKIMTAFVVFGELRAGRLSLDDEVTVSEKAWRTEGSRMFIEVNTRVRVEDLMQGMIVQSGNEASVALAEQVAGTEDTFAVMMNQAALGIGMTSSNFRNATGLPASDHYSTARDMALLARALIAKFPDYYGRWYSQREFTYNDITQRNRNALLWRDSTVDGVKTGMTEAAGYCLVASANRDNMRLISVVMGTPNANIRASASQSLLGYGFQFYETHKLFAAGEPLTSVRVWKGARERVDLGLDEDVFVIIPRGQRDSLNAEMDLNAQVIAPVTSDDELGTVRVSLNDEIVLEKPLHPLQAVASGDFLDRIMDEILLWFE